MAYQLVIQQEAIEDIKEAYLWYEEKRKGLGDELLDEIENSCQQICETPQYFGFINKKFRRFKLGRFPYKIIFETEGNNIIVIAFDHFRRNKKY